MVCRFALSGTATGPEAPTAGVVSGRFAVSSSDGSRIDAGMSLGLRALPSPRAELGGELTGVLGSSASAWPLIRPAGAIASSTEASVAAVDPFDVRLRSMDSHATKTRTDAASAAITRLSSRTTSYATELTLFRPWLVKLLPGYPVDIPSRVSTRTRSST